MTRILRGMYLYIEDNIINESADHIFSPNFPPHTFDSARKVQQVHTHRDLQSSNS